MRINQGVRNRRNRIEKYLFSLFSLFVSLFNVYNNLFWWQIPRTFIQNRLLYTLNNETNRQTIKLFKCLPPPLNFPRPPSIDNLMSHGYPWTTFPPKSNSNWENERDIIVFLSWKEILIIFCQFHDNFIKIDKVH